MKTEHLPFPSSDNLKGICQAFGLEITAPDSASFDLGSIKNFPKKHIREIEKIRKIIASLLVQIEPVQVYLLDLSTKEGKKKSEDKRKIDYLLPMFFTVFYLWLNEGLQIAGSEISLTFKFGVLKEKSSYTSKKMDEKMKEVRREFLQKSARSEESTSHILVD